MSGTYPQWMNHPKWIKAQKTLRPQIYLDHGVWHLAMPEKTTPPQPIATHRLAIDIATRYTNRLKQDRKQAQEARQKWLNAAA